MRFMDVDKLKPHPKNNYFFDDINGEPWTAFLESIETSGVIEPIIVSAPDLTIVSGHQRVRACKKLGIKQVAVEERSYESEDEILKQLIETNIRQRGVGNTNAVKLGRCIKELERIYGVRSGSAGKADPTKLGGKTQSDLAEEIGVSSEQLRKYKSLTDLIPELQDAVQSGQITATTAMGFVKKLSPEEQKKLAESISGQDKVLGKEVEQYIEEIKRLKEENEKLHDDNKILARRSAQEPIIMEKPVEIVPEDYREVKSKAKAYDAETKRLNSKLEEAYRERNELEDKIRELQEQTAREQTNNDTVASAIYFIAQCGSFIRDVGGYVWLADKIAELPEREREGYIKAIMAVRDWSMVLIDNIERSEYGKNEFERISSKSGKE